MKTGFYIAAIVMATLTANAQIVASFVYLAANRDGLLPRKPLPSNVHPAGSPVP